MSRPAPKELALVALGLLVWLSATAGLRLLALPDEGRYVGVAWEMIRSGDWLVPTLNGLPFFHKPPLFYWITAAALELFGLHPWAARLASVLGASLGGFAMYLFVRRWSGARMARLATLVLAVQPLFYIGAQFANLDMLVAGCISATVLMLADAALCIERDGPGRTPASLWAAYASAALGVLAKGLIGFVLPALVITVWLMLGRRWRTLMRLLSLRGALLFLLIAAPWFLAMQQRFPAFLHYFFVVQHFQRFAAGGFNNVQPFWFYPAVLALASLPCLPWLFARQRAERPMAQDLRLLMLVWLVVIVGFFSLPQSKLVGYVLPAVPPLAYLAADGAFGKLRHLRWWRGGLAVSLLVSVGVVVGLAVHPLRNSRGLAAALSSQPQAPLFMLKQYAYDLPFYARLPGPATVVDDWSDPAVQQRDNWRKELADARNFAPAGSRTLIEPKQLAAALCAHPVDWLLGDGELEGELRRAARPVASAGASTLWRIDASSLDCAGKPSAGLASR